MDVNEIFSIWPFDVLDEPIRLFYYLETGLYIHLTINHFFEVARKDFAVMLLHHVATMGLLTWSWLFNFTRVRHTQKRCDIEIFMYLMLDDERCCASRIHVFT